MIGIFHCHVTSSFPGRKKSGISRDLGGCFVGFSSHACGGRRTDTWFEAVQVGGSFLDLQNNKKPKLGCLLSN